jgi:hypothetical protein
MPGRFPAVGPFFFWLTHIHGTDRRLNLFARCPVDTIRNAPAYPDTTKAPTWSRKLRTRREIAMH